LKSQLGNRLEEKKSTTKLSMKKAAPDYRHWLEADVLWQIGFVYKWNV
jgi:hypothetical protein